MTVTVTERQTRRALYHALVTAPLVIMLAILGWAVVTLGSDTVASQYVAQFGLDDVAAMAVGFVYPSVARFISRRTAAYLSLNTSDKGLLNVRSTPMHPFAGVKVGLH